MLAWKSTFLPMSSQESNQSNNQDLFLAENLTFQPPWKPTVLKFKPLMIVCHSLAAKDKFQDSNQADEANKSSKQLTFFFLKKNQHFLSNNLTDLKVYHLGHFAQFSVEL